MGEFVNLEPSTVDGVAIMRLDRPKVNALNAQVGRELLETADEVAEQADIRALVLWGGPSIFAAGADIADFPIGEGHRDPSPMVDVLNEALLAAQELRIAEGPATGPTRQG